MPRPYLQLHLLIFILALTAILGKLIDLSAPVLVLWRTGLAALGLLLWQRLSSPVRASGPAGDGTPYRFKALGIGVILGLHWMTFFGSIRLSGVSVCLVGMATTSFFTALTEPMVNRCRLSRTDLLLGLMVIPGLLLIVGFNVQHWPGLVCALASALLAAIFPVLNRRLVLRGIPPSALTLYEMVGAFAVCVVLIPFFRGADPALWPSGIDWIWLLLLAFLCTAFAFTFHIRLLRHFTAFTANLAVNFEPVYGILLAMLIFGEHRELHPSFYLGALTIVAANILHVALKRSHS